jgi:hypothetical protein
MPAGINATEAHVPIMPALSLKFGKAERTQKFGVTI